MTVSRDPSLGAPRSATLQASRSVASLVTTIRSSSPPVTRVELDEQTHTLRLVTEEGHTEAAVGNEQITAAIKQYLHDRSYEWPALDSDVFEPERSPRVIFSPADGRTVLADLGDPKKPSPVILQNITVKHTPSLLTRVDCTAADADKINTAASHPRGIILCSHSKKAHSVDACAIVLAMRADAMLVPHCSSEALAQRAVDLAQRGLVVAGVSGENTIDMLLNFIGLLKNPGAAHEAAVESVLLSYVHAQIRRVCDACARSTPVDQRTVVQLPPALQKSVPSTYMFGRGCEVCGETAYRGTTGISSVLDVDLAMRDLLRAGSTSLHITRAAVAAGTRPLLADGLRKIVAGLTSFEQVLSVIKTISADFNLALSSPTAAPGIAAPRTDAQNAAVLIVEDDEDQRAALDLVFRSAGYRVTTVPNGRQALSQLESSPVDLIICDVMMPEMNGITLLKKIKSDARLRKTPMLMLTAVDSADAEVALLESGADDYCAKNVRKKVLLKRAERLIHGKKSSNPLGHMLEE